MASPIGHALADWALGRLGRGGEAPGGRLLLPACALIAVAPDLDFLPGLLVGRPTLYHQGASHSLAAALAVSLGVALVLIRRPSLLLRGWAVLFAAYASHLALDFFGPDARPPIGIPVFWPASDATWLSPWAILPGVRHAASGLDGSEAWLAAVFSWHNLQPILVEGAVLAPLLLLALLRRQPCCSAAAGVRAARSPRRGIA